MTWPADLVLAVTLAEAALLTVLRRRWGLSMADIAGLLLPGAALALALHLALAGARLAAILLALLAAGVLHGFDLCRRLRHAPLPRQPSVRLP